MTAPEDFTPTPESDSAPFGSQPTEPMAGGCSRIGLIGCGVITLLLGIGAVLFLLKAGDLFAWAMTQFEEQIVLALPEDCTESERQRLREAFENVGTAVRSGEFDPLALQRLQGKLRDSLLDEDQKLTREQVLELISILEEVAGQAPDEKPAEEESSASAIAALSLG
jgi:hypothetical protein